MTADNHKTTGLREAAMLALDALTSVHYDPANPATDKDRLARMALREALAVPDAKPYAWCVAATNCADWAFAGTEEGVKENALFMDADCIKTQPFPLYTSPQSTKPTAIGAAK